MKLNLQNIGFDDWFAERTRLIGSEELSPARIAAVNKNSYLIRGETGEAFAELSGKMIYSTQSSLDYPAAGDWVLVQYFNEDEFAVIHEILERRTLLRRKTAGIKVDHQLIAANIDVAFIMQSVDSNYNLRRLERYLVMANDSHIQPVILLSKTDVLQDDEILPIIEEIHQLDSRYNILPFSNVDGSGLDAVKKFIEPGKTYCLLGSSGVGKTTLLNNLLGEDIYDVNDVRAGDGKGRHTTTRRELTILDDGGIFIDTPGMRELGNFSIEEGLNETFEDIAVLAEQCRFSNCTHTSETGCAVVSAVNSGTLDEKRYQNYLKMRKESAFFEMSYLEKRKRDKEFGKMVKRVMKDHRKR